MNVFYYECELQLQTLAESSYPNTSISDIQSTAEQLQQKTKYLNKNEKGCFKMRQPFFSYSEVRLHISSVLSTYFKERFCDLSQRSIFTNLHQLFEDILILNRSSLKLI